MSLRSALAQRSGRARRWLARHWWLARHRGEAPLDPRAHQPPLPLPGGYTRAELLAALCTAAQDPAAAAELTAYLELDCDRFLYTLSLIPEDEDLLGLEIGAGPYFTTLLARWFRPRLRLELTNYFGGPPCERVPHVLKTTRPDGVTEEIDLSYANVNLEAHPLPFADARYDLVLFCEVLEHMTQDPLRCLLEIGRVLKPGGRLIVTTPNVARLENVARLIVGENIYDPYSGHGPHGRHNREYSQHELYHLLLHAGFRTESMFTADVHPSRAFQLVPEPTLRALVGFRASSLGQYLFFVARKEGAGEPRKPTWLYRSHPPSELIDSPI
jgi:SAM-dependent methyltransferase